MNPTCRNCGARCSNGYMVCIECRWAVDPMNPKRKVPEPSKESKPIKEQEQEVAYSDSKNFD